MWEPPAPRSSSRPSRSPLLCSPASDCAPEAITGSSHVGQSHRHILTMERSSGSGLEWERRKGSRQGRRGDLG